MKPAHSADALEILPPKNSRNPPRSALASAWGVNVCDTSAKRLESVRFRTNAMIHGVALYISAISRYCTMEAGDVLWMGTDDKSPDLKHGDVVEVEITGLGVLRNRFVKEGMA